jgi:hypothetical protein
MKYKKTNDMLQDWRDGKEVYSVSMGGFGSAYESVIQQSIFHITNELRLLDLANIPKDERELYYKTDFDRLVFDNRIEKGMTGAQYGAIKTVVWQFLLYGYDTMMKKAPKDRIIKVKLNKAEVLK